MKSEYKKIIRLFMIAGIICFLLAGCSGRQVVQDKTEITIGDPADKDEKNPVNSHVSASYGVFLDYDGDLEALSYYDYLVIDAAFFNDTQIGNVKGNNRYVYSYLNVGSLEDFRDYYDEFSDLTLGDYENWQGEKWIDVSDKRWQDFILNELAPGLLAKGISGFFVDNLDVYYEYPTKEIFDGLTVILKGLKSFGCDVIINGGDTFLDAYTEKGGDFREIITGINQECVFTGIDWENDRLIQSSEEDREYFSDYIEKYADRGACIFMIEYAGDGEENSSLRQDIKNYAEKHGFLYYIADSIALQAEREGENMKEAATLLYQGHASMRITTPEGKTIYVDPFKGTGYDVPADLILETHGHYDHTQTDLIKTKNDDCVTITWKEGINDGEHQTFDLGYVKVEAVEAGYNKNHDAKECVGFILTFSNEITLYISGDTSTTPQMEDLADRELDYAFFCCDGVYNMAMPEAIECAKTVGARHSIPYHMIPGNNSEGFDQSVAEQFEVTGSMIVRPGEELVLE